MSEELCPGCVRLGVPILDKLLPRGIHRRSFVVIEGEGGAGKSLLLHLMVKSFLERGEEVVYVAIDDDTASIAESLAAHSVDVDREVNEGRLMLIDGCAARYGVPPGKYAYDRLTSLEPSRISKTLEGIVEARGMKNRGLIVLDSINPLFLAYEPTTAYDLICRIRANMAKARGILTVATLHTTSSMFEEVAQTLDYMVDAVIVASYHVRALEAGAPVRRLLVKKAKGVPVSYGWISYIITDEGPVEVRVKEGGR